MSVRKRVVKIMREILLQRLRRPGGLSADVSRATSSVAPASQEEHPSTRDICLALMRRIQDEESVRRLVVDVFQQLLFVPIERHMARLFSGQGDISASLGAFNDELVDFYDSKLRTRVLLIMDMVRSFNMSCRIKIILEPLVYSFYNFLAIKNLVLHLYSLIFAHYIILFS